MEKVRGYAWNNLPCNLIDYAFNLLKHFQNMFVIAVFLNIVGNMNDLNNQRAGQALFFRYSNVCKARR